MNARMVLGWYQQWFQKNREQNNTFPPPRHTIHCRNSYRHLGWDALLCMTICPSAIDAVQFWVVDADLARARLVRDCNWIERERSKNRDTSWLQIIMAWHTQMASKKVSVSSTSLSMTLPISCQICLGKVSWLLPRWNSFPFHITC